MIRWSIVIALGLVGWALIAHVARMPHGAAVVTLGLALSVGWGLIEAIRAWRNPDE